MEIKKVIIGLEVHTELRTLSKMFCGCSADHFGKEPNTQTCPVCLGLPGSLPVPNKKAIDWTILIGLALGGKIQKFTRFDRKNYFYPDLPKGYQISQYEEPFILGGKVILDSGKEIGIKRVHLEEDTGKLIHKTIDNERFTLIDFNRSGVPLVEIVSEPDLNTSDEAKEYLEKLHQMVRYLNVSDADMEKGSMRLEPNVNLEIAKESKSFYTPIVEIKNINSFRFAKRAIDFEIKRQFDEFQEKRIEKAKGNKKTRGWDEEKGKTFPQREKEEANDYRYFPEPDIPPIEWSEEQLTAYGSQLTAIELPWNKKKRFMIKYRLSDYQAKILTAEEETADYYEEAVKLGNLKGADGGEVANILINKRAPENLSTEKLIDWILSSKVVSSTSNEDIIKLIDKLLAEHPETVESYKKGKIQALGMIIGLVKKETGVIVSLEEIASKIK